MTNLDLSHRLPEALGRSLRAVLEDWRAGAKVDRLWRRDATLWTGADEADWLGWLTIADEQLQHLGALAEFSRQVETEGYAEALLLGMGGSSLCAEVLSRTFGQQRLHPRFQVLDSTDPAQVQACEQRLDLSRTLFFVSSKSGTTLEPNALLQYFFDRVRRLVGSEVGRRFVAITDPGSKLEDRAGELGFLHVFYGEPDIGGRFSALSHFGLVPAAAMGLDLERLLAAAGRMAEACRPDKPIEANPGALLGAILGAAALAGRDKLTLVASPGIDSLGAWLEQLVAESTGKRGQAVIPIDGEPLLAPELYGEDRLFVYLRLESAPGAEQDAAVERLENAGQPVVRLALADAWDLGAEFFRWELATAVAGSILEVNPFDQRDVEASKVASRHLTSEYEGTGELPRETPFHVGERLRLFADAANARALRQAAGEGAGAVALLGAHLARLRPGDYFALLAYLEMSPAHREALQAIRRLVLEHRRVATCLGFGPRFLHSTGQAYKGGPNRGVFLQITSDDAVDLPVPGQRYSFGVIKAAQARGDFEVLAERGRRALRVHLGADVLAGLKQLRELVAEAVGQPV